MNLFISFIAGCLYPLGFPSEILTHHPIFSLLGMLLFLMNLKLFKADKEALTLLKKLVYLLVFSFGYFLVGYYWLGYTLHQFGGIDFPLNYILSSLFTLFIAPHLLAFILIEHFILSKVKKKNLHLWVFLYSIILVLLELLTPQQFPAHLGHTWLSLKPFLFLSTYFGYGVFSFISYLLLFSFLYSWKEKKIHWSSSFIILFLLLLSFLNPIQKENEIASPLAIRMVQGNIGNFMKVESEQGNFNLFQKVLERYQDLSEAPISEDNPIELIVWPETAYPALLNSQNIRANQELVPKTLKEVTRNTGAYLFTGSYDVADKADHLDFETEHSAAFYFAPNSHFIDVYHKRILIPFGESLPFGFLNPLFSKLIKNIAFFAKGKRYPFFEVRENIHFISAICYEILFPDFVRNYLNNKNDKAHFLVNITNDSWYGKSSEPYQHKFLAHWRAIEFNLPIVRITNTGISSILYPDGSESKQLGLFQTGYMDLELPIVKNKKTFYQRWGLLGLTLFMLGCFLISLTFFFLQNLLLKDREA